LISRTYRFSGAFCPFEGLTCLSSRLCRGSFNYYGRYYKSAMYPTLRSLDRRLAQWATRKYKRLRGHRRRAAQWLAPKSHVVKTNECKFLGFTFQSGRIHWHPKTLQKFKQQVRRLTNRNWSVSMKYQLLKISQYLRGWINYFGIASGYQRCVDLDHWIRSRVRMAYWRQWRRPRTKVKA